MQYQSDGTQVTTRPAPAAVTGTPGWVASGSPGIQAASDDDPDVMNQLLDELCGVCVAAGLTLSKTDSTQLLQAIQTLGRRMVTFTSSGSWTAPTGSYRAKIRIWAGGGGGGNGGGGGGGGGAAGGYFEGYISVVPGTTYSVTVGALGYPGSAGGTSSFGSIASATGGGAGSNGPNGAGNTAFGTGSGTGRASLGQSGQNGVSTSAQNTGGQGGGVVDYNGGAAQPVGAGGNAAGNNGQIGCGGSGGAGTGAGGNGGAGLLIVEY